VLALRFLARSLNAEFNTKYSCIESQSEWRRRREKIDEGRESGKRGRKESDEAAVTVPL